MKLLKRASQFEYIQLATAAPLGRDDGHFNDAFALLSHPPSGAAPHRAPPLLGAPRPRAPPPRDALLRCPTLSCFEVPGP